MKYNIGDIIQFDRYIGNKLSIASYIMRIGIITELTTPKQDKYYKVIVCGLEGEQYWVHEEDVKGKI